ncbi:MAG: discoidin domain-containing protein [Thalassotalea sp.]
MTKNTIQIAAITAALALTGINSVFAATPTSITASDAQSGHPAVNSHDGNIDTRWSAQGNGQWVQYDFGAAVTLSAIDIAFLKGDSRAATFQIESTNTPDNASSWQQQAMGQSSGSSAELESYALSDNVTARYFRIVGYGNSSNNWNSITETTFIDGTVEPPVEPPVACNAPVLASADDGNVAENVTDGSLSTRWSANGNGQWLRLDLCQEQTINQVEVAFFKGDSRSSTFSIEVSSDDVNWSTALSTTASASNTTAKQAFDFEAKTARYVRYTGYGNSSNSWNSITEFSVAACTGSSCDVVDVCEADYNSQACLDIRCETNPDGDNCPVIPQPEGCEAQGKISYNGSCAEWLAVYEAEHGDIGENDHLISYSPIEMTFDALAAKHITSNGNGWRHELKIKSSGGYRVGMTEVYELFKAKITIDLDKGAKTIVAQHHADTTATITKLYIADLDEGGFEAAPDGTESDSVAMNGVFDVYIRLAKADGSGETKHLLTTMRSGESFDFEEENDHGKVTVKINGQTLAPITVNDSSASYFKFGNYQQAQNPETGEKLASGDKDGDWAEFFAKYFSTSKITFTNMSYIRNVD